MKPLLIPMKEEEFKQVCKIRVKNIMQGMNDYINGILEINHDLGERETFENFNLKYEDRFIKFMEKLYDINKEAPVVVDLYLKDVNPEGIIIMLNSLDYNDQITLINHVKNIKGDEIYFKIDSKELIPFITKLSTRELHFCTIHFTKIPVTIWGNYNLAFPIFCEKLGDLNFYKNIAEEFGIIMVN
ncbi:hypothetical protein [Clostridium paridis]|uniref:Uncharacterized protein n=1 Tax=Clostridium paridis TaxID=2803863 RepID=A0A937K447_9CLOT|nr:hypothetical protein [Clostridium paridis]MBL4931484.1 hypothetical protein [Clostridium paridis]